MSDLITRAQELLSNGQLQDAEDLLTHQLNNTTGLDQANALMLLSDIAWAQKKISHVKSYAFNAAAALINDGHLADALVWLGSHLNRLRDDVAARLLNRDLLRHLAALIANEAPDQAETFHLAANDLELERSFLRTATPKAAADWVRQRPWNSDSQAMIREICAVLPSLAPALRLELYLLIEDEIPSDLSEDLLGLMALTTILNTQPDCLLHRRLVERWSQEVVRPSLANIKPLVAPTGPLVAEQRLRVGFIDITYLCSLPNYRETLITPSLTALAQDLYDIFIYIYPGADYHIVSDFDNIIPPGITARKIDLSLAGAEIIAADNLDVLLLMNGYVQNLPFQFFLTRPAKRLALWMHTFGTYGPDLFDATLIDEYSFNNLHAQMSYEEPIGGGGILVLLGPPQDAPPISPLAMRKNGFATFGVLARPEKLGPYSYQLWVPILLALPNARLRLYGTGFMSDIDITQMKAEMMNAGLPMERIDFAPFIDGHANYLKDIGEVDIVLDSYPYTGGLTTFEALWQGIPVISRKSETPIGRSGFAYLSEAGMPELVVETAQDYSALAVSLARNMDRLEELRYGLRQTMQQSQLMDADRFRGRFRRAMEQLLALPARGLTRTMNV